MSMIEWTRELALCSALAVICRTPRITPMMIHAKPSETRTNIDHFRAAVDSMQLRTDCSQHSSFEHPPTPARMSTHSRTHKSWKKIRYIRKDLVTKQLFPVTLTNRVSSTKLSTRKSAVESTALAQPFCLNYRQWETCHSVCMRSLSL